MKERDKIPEEWEKIPEVFVLTTELYAAACSLVQLLVDNEDAIVADILDKPEYADLEQVLDKIWQGARKRWEERLAAMAADERKKWQERLFGLPEGRKGST